MAVIDLGSGKKTTIQPEDQSNGFGGRVIDLETGKPSLGVQPIPQLQEQLEQIAEERPPIENQDTRTRAERELPEMAFSGLLSEEPAADVAKVSAALITATNPREMGNILTANFPHIGIIEDEKGNLIAANNKTGVQAVINKPGVSPIDVLQTIGITSSFIPSAQIASIPASVAARGGVGALTAGLTQASMETLQSELGGELDADEIAIASSLGGATELVVPAINALRQSRQSKEVVQSLQAAEDVAGQVQIGREASEATGIPLFEAQQTTIPAQLEKQSFIAQLPAGTQKASKELAKQNQAASSAVDDFLAMIAPDESVITGPAKIRSAAQNAIEARQIARSEKASPLYKQAFDEGAEVDLTPITSQIDDILAEFPESGEVAKSVLKVQKLIGESPSLKRLHNTKVEIDQMIAKVGDGSIGNTTKRQLTGIKNTLLDQLDESSPMYKEAREAFESASPSVNKIQESIIGKIADLDDTQLKNASRRIFDPAETNPAVIRKAKKIIDDVDPDAWNQIFRSEIERRLGGIKSTMEAGSTENIPGQIFNSLFGNTKQRAVLFNSVDGDAKKNLKYLETALSRARLGRGTGSQTAIRGEIKKELEGGAGAAIRDFFKGPIKAVAGLGEDATFDARVRSLANAMFDPQWKVQVKKLRALSPNSPAAGRAMAQLLDDAISADLKNIEEPE